MMLATAATLSAISFGSMPGNASITTATSTSGHAAGSDVTTVLWKIFGPMLLIVGIVGNSLVLVTMTQRRMRGTSTCVYLVGMAIIDMTVLVTGLACNWLAGAYGVDIKEMDPIVCKFQKFLDYTTGDAAVWVRVAFTFDRLIAVLVPLYVGVCCGRQSTARIYVLVASLGAVAKNVHVFWTRGAMYSTSATVAENSTNASTALVLTDKCGYPTPEYKHFEQFVRPWIAFAVVSVLPFVVIAVCNTLIIIALVKRRRATVTFVRQSSGSGGSQKEQQFVQMAAMCVASSMLFLVCSAPSIVVLIGKPKWNDPPGGNAAYEVTKAVSNLLFYVTFSANFFLYCVTGDRFRTTLRETLERGCCCCCIDRNSVKRRGTTTTTTTTVGRKSATPRSGSWTSKRTTAMMTSAADGRRRTRQTDPELELCENVGYRGSLGKSPAIGPATNLYVMLTPEGISSTSSPPPDATGNGIKSDGMSNALNGSCRRGSASSALLVSGNGRIGSDASDAGSSGHGESDGADSRAGENVGLTGSGPDSGEPRRRASTDGRIARSNSHPLLGQDVGGSTASRGGRRRRPEVDREGYDRLHTVPSITSGRRGPDGKPRERRNT